MVSSHTNVLLRIVDVKHNQMRAKEMCITAVPTLVFNNEVIYIGTPTVDELDAALNAVITRQPPCT